MFINQKRNHEINISHRDMAFHSLGTTLNLKTFVYQGNNRAKSDLYNGRMYL